jgi:ferredoxin
VEYFSAAPVIGEGGGAFTVVLARLGQSMTVEAGETILQALRRIGVPATSSCEQGICGTCETRVLGGEPDHRDTLLSDEEKAAGKSMLICCSRSRSAELVLDL